jgi:predicted N-acyltransferase
VAPTQNNIQKFNTNLPVEISEIRLYFVQMENAGSSVRWGKKATANPQVFFYLLDENNKRTAYDGLLQYQLKLWEYEALINQINDSVTIQVKATDFKRGTSTGEPYFEHTYNKAKYTGHIAYKAEWEITIWFTPANGTKKLYRVRESASMLR